MLSGTGRAIYCFGIILHLFSSIGDSSFNTFLNEIYLDQKQYPGNVLQTLAEVCEIFKNTFFIKHFRWLLLLKKKSFKNKAQQMKIMADFKTGLNHKLSLAWHHRKQLRNQFCFSYVEL